MDLYTESTISRLDYLLGSFVDPKHVSSFLEHSIADLRRMQKFETRIYHSAKQLFDEYTDYFKKPAMSSEVVLFPEECKASNVSAIFRTLRHEVELQLTPECHRWLTVVSTERQLRLDDNAMMSGVGRRLMHTKPRSKCGYPSCGAKDIVVAILSIARLLEK
ncbi:hypothetical protein P9112_005824 [Eukaryota sp. TZLM1-RC]